MKKTLLILFALVSAATMRAQLNVQLHYDYGHLTNSLSNRPSMTSTVEYFGMDKWGTTFFFIDMDYYHDGVAGAYWEISRSFPITKKSPFSLHLEYNGGAQVIQDIEVGNRFQHNVLGGLEWSCANKDFTRTLTLEVLYKYYFKGANGARAYNSFQLTGVWDMHFFDKKLTFSGFADLWYDHTIDNLVFAAEPQLWLNINRFKGCEGFNLSVGGEIEISNNFIYPKDGTNNRFYAIPTTAVKWTF